MKKTEEVFREILHKGIEEKKFNLTQSELSKKLGISLSIINSAVKRLENMGAIKIKQREFQIIDIRKILFHWASLRNIKQDIIFKARIEMPAREIERIMPDVTFTAFSAFKLMFDDVPADYSEVYVYASDNELNDIKNRISSLKFNENDINSNFFVLKKDKNIDLYKSIPFSNLFVDLWNLKEWYAKDFLNALENKLEINKEGAD
ncbi:MAG: winged helix-turn-helix transcriptional regulator [Nanoarchaeota archaeon]